MKIVTVVGARPQFIKAAAVSRIIATHFQKDLQEILVHTGQHFDRKMSDVFFDELGIPSPKYNLGVSGGTHGTMTGKMLATIEEVLLQERPSWLLIYGDTNSTLAAALAAAKLNIPIAHIEAGLRSFNNHMPEEINRIVADRLSSLLLCPTETAISNLTKEGITKGVHHVGDVMYDVALHFAQIAESQSPILDKLNITKKEYVLTTCHRAENTDDPAKLAGIISGLANIAEQKVVVFPLHPRTREKIQQYGFQDKLKKIIVTDPLSYLDIVALEKNAEVIITDSGGIQKEAFFYRIPCITTRNETEWTETVTSGWNTLVGYNSSHLLEAVENHMHKQRVEMSPYGDGKAAEHIIDVLLKQPI